MFRTERSYVFVDTKLAGFMAATGLAAYFFFCDQAGDFVCWD